MTEKLGKAKRKPTPAGATVDDDLEEIKSEEEDRAYSPPSYDIVTYPADFTLEVLVHKLTKNPPEIRIPPFQRKFVWTQSQASKLIESFLLGLPVPPIFLYTDAENIQMVVDGQQRLKSIEYYFEGYFGPEDRGSRPVFRLTGLNEESPYSNLTYKDLESEDQVAFRKLNDSVLRAFVIKQLNPKDHTSVFHVFERLNTGGTFLTGQEIRNCVYAGSFNQLLLELNLLQAWRELFGKTDEDKRQRDVELILRFFALKHALDEYKKPLKDFLSTFMFKYRNPSSAKLRQFREEFEGTTDALLEHLGPKPFHLRAGLNAAAFDSVAVAFSNHLGKIPKDIGKRFGQLKADRDFEKRISSATTDEESLSQRMTKAATTLFG
jgi:uncharacterized protein with ParB-like and HNH nuclease domain